MRASGLQLGLQAAPKALADCHTNMALVNVGSQDASNLLRRPAHDLGSFVAAQPGKDQLRAKRAPQIVHVLLFGRPGLRISVDDVCVITNSVEACPKSIACPR